MGTPYTAKEDLFADKDGKVTKGAGRVTLIARKGQIVPNFTAARYGLIKPEEAEEANAGEVTAVRVTGTFTSPEAMPKAGKELDEAAQKAKDDAKAEADAKAKKTTSRATGKAAEKK